MLPGEHPSVLLLSGAPAAPDAPRAGERLDVRAAGALERAGARVLRVSALADALAAVDSDPVDLAVVCLDTDHDVRHEADRDGGIKVGLDAGAAARACAALRGRLGEAPSIAVLDPGGAHAGDGAGNPLVAAGADIVAAPPPGGEGLRALADSWVRLARLSMRVRKLEHEIPLRMKELNDIRGFTDELVASLPTKLYVVDEDMRVLFANRTAAEEVGLNTLSAIGKPLGELLRAAAEEDGPLAALVRRALLEDEAGRLGGVHVGAGLRGDGPAGGSEARVIDAEVRPCPVGGMRCALITVADVTDAWKAESGRQRETRKLAEVVDAIGAGLATLDGTLRFTWTNRTFVEWFGPSTGRTCREVFAEMHGGCPHDPEALAGEGPSDPDCPATRSLATGEYEATLRHRYDSEGRRRTFQESFARIQERDGAASLMMLVQDVTARVDRIEQMQLAEQIARAVQGVRDLDGLLHMILTCVTTGHALGFNRAFLFLRNRRTNTLDGRMAVGPASAEEAGRVWSELSAKQQSLDDALRDAEREGRDRPGFETPLFEVIHDLSYSFDDRDDLPVRAFAERRAILVRDAWSDERLSPAFRERFGANELLAVPLLSKGRAVGVLMADNIYNGRPIEEGDRAVLEMFAGPAGLAIENAEAFADLRESLDTLKRTRRQLVDQTKLAAVGRVAAHIAHEIRNPLATIGGFAHSIRAHPDDTERVKENARIVYDEVRRLERILSGIMDFSRPTRPVPVRQSLNAVLERAAAILSEELRPRASVRVALDPGAAETAFDAEQIQQVVINLVRNAAEAMGEIGGEVRVATHPHEDGVEFTVADDGPGIPREIQDRVFEPFFTTRKGGTGLGLAVCHQIAVEHGGEMRLDSAPGRGACFTVVLPAEPPQAGELEGEDLP